jgi:alcohol dehydrogenase class IV
MNFSFSTANSIHFGDGMAKNLCNFLPKSAKRVLVVTGANPERHQFLINRLTANEIEATLFPVTSEPTTDLISSGLRKARAFQPQVVIGLGGGSAIDTGKAISALLQNSGDLLDYLEVVGKGGPLIHRPLPYMAIPTTAGTGSEVTRNSVIGVPDSGVKVSLRSPYMIPRWAVVDPELTYDLPANIAAYTGMDALIQCLEAYLSRKSNPLSDGIALEGIRHAARSIRKACADQLDPDAKSEMCVASLCGGIALANAGLGAVHGFAGPIGGMINAPHGALCASLLLSALRTNFDIASRRKTGAILVRKLDQVAQIVTGNPSAKGNYAIAWFESLLKDLPLASLSELGFTEAMIPEAVKKSAQSSSMKGNPIDLDNADLREILEDCL